MASAAPQVRLGERLDGGLAPAILAIVERGVYLRPALAVGIEAEVELMLQDGFPPVRIVFAERHVIVEDGPAVGPDLRVTGTLADLIDLLATPLLAGLPSPVDRRGRAALSLLAQRRVRIEGRLALMRRVLGLIRI